MEGLDFFPPPHRFTVAEYLAFEERSEFKHEFIDGVIYDCGDVLPGDPIHPEYVPGYPMPHLFSAEEYLAFEAESEFKHEFVDGVIYDMTGGTSNHSEIKVNLTYALGMRLRESGCWMRDSDMRVKVSEGKHVFPDLSVVCGPPLLDEDETVLLNPVVIFEVLSPTSVGYDRYTKLEYYRELPSIEAYVIIDQHECFVDLHSRTGTGWHWQAFSDIDDVVPLPVLNCSLPLNEIYRGINFSDD